MTTMRATVSLPLVRGWLALPFLLAACLSPAAADGPPSPVGAFRDALRLPENRFELKEKDIKAYRVRLQANAKAIVRPGDLRRALALPEWGNDLPRGRL